MTNPRPKQACSSFETLRKATVLAMMKTDLDTTRAIVVETGQVISLSGYSALEIATNINNQVWVYYENEMPRRMFLTNPNWSVNSFDSRLGQVCITMQSPAGNRVFNLSVKP